MHEQLIRTSSGRDFRVVDGRWVSPLFDNVSSAMLGDRVPADTQKRVGRAMLERLS